MKTIWMMAMAWVLWNELTFMKQIESSNSNSDNTYWVIISATPTYEECKQDQNTKVKDLLRSGESNITRGPNVASEKTEQRGDNSVTTTTHLKNGDILSNMYRLLCLPDTVDPRGPRQ